MSGGGGEAESFGVVAKRPKIAESEEVRGEGGETRPKIAESEEVRGEGRETRCPSLGGPEASVLLR